MIEAPATGRLTAGAPRRRVSPAGAVRLGARPLAGWLRPAAIVLAALLAALLIGAISGLGSPLLLLPFVGLGGLAFAFMLPSRWLVWLLFVSAFLVVGPVIYFLRIDSARWLSPGLAMSLMIPYVAGLLGRTGVRARGELVPAHFYWYFAFLFVLTCSTVLSSPRVGEVILSTRVYLAYLPLALLVLSGFVSESTQLRLWRFMLLCALVQVPVVAYQAFVIAPNRGFQTAVWDAVVGTFPGNPETGGSNAGMSLFMLVTALVALSLWRHRVMRGWQAAVLTLAALAVILMGEVKAIVLMIPVGLAMLFYRDLLRRPLLSILGIVGGLVVASAVFVVYDRVYYAGRVHSASADASPTTAAESIQNQLNPQLAIRGNIASRAYTFADWGYRNLRASRLPEALLGYGTGSTQVGRLGIGEVAEKLTYKADITATGLLLWDTGIVGHVLMALSFAAAGLAALRLARREHIPVEHRAILQACAAAMVLHLLCLPYKDFMFRAAPAQLFLFFIMGYIGYWQRRSRPA